MAELIFYPNAHIENTSVDGYTIRYGVDETWADITTNVGNWAADSGNTLVLQIIASTTNGQWERMYRNAILFDISALPAGATITVAVLSLYGDWKDDNLSATPDANIYAATPASDTEIVEGDHLSYGTVAFCDTPKTYGNWSTNSYNNFTLNAAGLIALRAALAGTGIFKLGLRNANYDVAEELDPGNHAPNWVSGVGSQLRAHSADNTSGTSKAPRLVITYTGDEPTITTQAVTSIMLTTATGNGNITSIGDASVTQHGVCWNTTGTPDTFDDNTEEGAAAGTGAFTSSMTSLLAATKYYVRPYAINIFGTSYGSEVNFTTKRVGELAGPIKIVEERFHYVDAYGVERALLGEVV